jgi:hypothetical protein
MLTRKAYLLVGIDLTSERAVGMLSNKSACADKICIMHALYLLALASKYREM